MFRKVFERASFPDQAIETKSENIKKIMLLSFDVTLT